MARPDATGQQSRALQCLQCLHAGTSLAAVLHRGCSDHLRYGSVASWLQQACGFSCHAGSVKFRLFSPTQALQQDVKSLKAPLTPQDSDADLLADTTKLAAAGRQLDGRAVKLLPDER